MLHKALVEAVNLAHPSAPSIPPANTRQTALITIITKGYCRAISQWAVGHGSLKALELTPVNANLKIGQRMLNNRDG